MTTDDPARSKQMLRAAATAARRAIPADVLEANATTLARIVLTEVESMPQQIGVVAAYVPFGSEPGSDGLLNGLIRWGLTLMVPFTRSDRDLDWFVWTGTEDDSPALLGRSVIERADLVLVPALRVDRQGHRLGRGGGSYDRALARIRPGTPVAALLHDGELLAEVPADPWDVPVSAAVTPADGWTPLGTINDYD